MRESRETENGEIVRQEESGGERRQKWIERGGERRQWIERGGERRKWIEREMTKLFLEGNVFVRQSIFNYSAQY